MRRLRHLLYWQAQFDSKRPLLWLCGAVYLLFAGPATLGTLALIYWRSPWPVPGSAYLTALTIVHAFASLLLVSYHASRAADAIHSRGLFTNIGAALEAASQGQAKPDPDWERTIVLLSDGMVDISKDPAVNAKEKARILDIVVPKLRAACADGQSFEIILTMGRDPV